jgi:hypothetical protein
MKSSPLVLKYGEMWARNTDNIGKLPRHKEESGQGLYVLYDGSLPVYIGKGNLHQRLGIAHRSTRRGPFWNYFSWYGISDPSLVHNIEALLLSTIPPNLRGLNRQSGKLKDAQKVVQKDHQPQPITRRPSK